MFKLNYWFVNLAGDTEASVYILNTEDMVEAEKLAARFVTSYVRFGGVINRTQLVKEAE